MPRTSSQKMSIMKAKQRAWATGSRATMRRIDAALGNCGISTAQSKSTPCSSTFVAWWCNCIAAKLSAHRQCWGSRTSAPNHIVPRSCMSQWTDLTPVTLHTDQQQVPPVQYGCSTADARNSVAGMWGQRRLYVSTPRSRHKRSCCPGVIASTALSPSSELPVGSWNKINIFSCSRQNLRGHTTQPVSKRPP